MRSIGQSELKVSVLGLGCSVFGWTVDEPNAFRLLDAFTDHGGNFIDTADVYSDWVVGNIGGESETIIGRWLKSRRNRESIVIATKSGMPTADLGGGLSKGHLSRSLEGSLRRLQTDYIDLYQAHVDDPDVPQDETLRTYESFIRQGMIRTIGASNFTAERLSLALDKSREYRISKFQSIQTLYNLYDRLPFEVFLEPICTVKEISVLCYSSLAHGFLSGKYRAQQDLVDKQRGNFVERCLNGRGFRILAALDQISRSYDLAHATISLAWLLARPTVTSAIASATDVGQLREQINASSLNLEQAALDFLDQASEYDPEIACQMIGGNSWNRRR